jgi:DNA polymerase-3 subunit alpha
MSEAPPFVHLHVRSHYSLLAAPSEVSGLVEAAAADGQTALALTDNGNLFGAVEFFKACKDKKVKPIVGQTTYVAGKTRGESAGADNPTYDLTLLAKDNEGLDNLKKLSGRAWLEGFSYRPRVDLEILQAHSRGIIALSGTVSSQISTQVLQGDPVGAKRTANQLRELFGADNFFFEVAETGYEQQQKVTRALRAFGQELGIPCVATNDVHYLKAEDWLAQDIMLCIRSGKTVADPQRFRMGSKELFLKSRAQMAAAFVDWPEALANTVAIAERCNVDIEFGVYHLPVFQPEDGTGPDAFFERICTEGAIRRYGAIDATVRQRLEFEIGVIKKLGFVSYFLIVQDFIQKAKTMGIPVGPGRGSAAGSIVAYVLGITDVCPLKYALLFERFLNPGRVSMPDIDIDFCGNRRDEVIQYVRQKYGNDCVCQIITFGTMASRGVLRDVGRVLDFPIADVDKLCKKVPQGPGASLQAALESDAELKQIRDSSPQHKRLFDLSLKLEGLARHSSIHAAGVVIADRPLRDYVPLAKNGEDVITQWQMTELEEVGLLKMDFLGLKTLTILQEAARLVKEVHGVDVDLGKLPLDDRPTYELIARGETQGIFQLESSGMRELLTRLKPDTFEDVIAVLALYRPGPLGSGMVDMFVDRKHGKAKTEYPHEATKPVLEATYGVIVYQEQVMQISAVIGGFSMTEADNLRKAMGKKKPEVMAKFKDQFIAGAVKQGYGEKFAKELFETMEYFAGYGFNKSHSTAYALVTYQTAWLKAHYPIEFTAANLTVESGNSDKIKEFVDETRRAGVAILPPSVNHSQRYFGVEGKQGDRLRPRRGVGRGRARRRQHRRRAQARRRVRGPRRTVRAARRQRDEQDRARGAGAGRRLRRHGPHARRRLRRDRGRPARLGAGARGPQARPKAAVRRARADGRGGGDRDRRRRMAREGTARAREGVARLLPVRPPVREARRLPRPHRRADDRVAGQAGAGRHDAHRRHDQLGARAADQAGQERRPEDGALPARGPPRPGRRHLLRAQLRQPEGPHRRRRDRVPDRAARRQQRGEGAAARPAGSGQRGHPARGRRPRGAPARRHGRRSEPRARRRRLRPPQGPSAPAARRRRRRRLLPRAR